MSDQVNSVELTIEVVASFVGRNNVRPDAVPALIGSIHA